MFELKSWWIVAVSFLINGYGYAQYINEFHYDNTGTDVGEFIEVVIPHPQPEDLSHYKIYNYNGADSMFYLDRTLNGIPPNCMGDSCFYVWARQTLLQNGPRDGIAFAYEDETDTIVFDFISYEGVLLALDGPARGMTSIDVGVEEDSSTPIGWSLQKDASGIWFAGPATPGIINPVELVSFTGEYVADIEGVLLEWTTVSEINNEYFEIQRSSDQFTFLPIGTVDGAGTRQDSLQYSFVDRDPYPGRAYYRLQLVDYDGSYTYSDVIVVNSSTTNSVRDLVPIFRRWNLSFVSNGFGDFIDVTIYDALGRVLLSRKNIHPNDVIPFDFPIRGLVFFYIQSGEEIHSCPIVVGAR